MSTLAEVWATRNMPGVMDEAESRLAALEAAVAALQNPGLIADIAPKQEEKESG